MSDEKIKKITLSKILGYGFGGLFIIGGIGILTSGNLLSGLAELLAGLVIFPLSYGFVRSRFHLELSKAVRVVLVLVLLGIAGSGLVGQNSSVPPDNDLQNPNTEVEQKKEASVLNLSAFIADFDSNQLAAESKYGGNYVQLAGYVGNISQDILANYFVTLQPTNDEYYFGTHVQCFFDNKDSLIAIANGEYITVKGTVESQNLGIISLEHCEIVVE